MGNFVLWFQGHIEEEEKTREHWTPDRKSGVRCPMPSNTLRVHTVYVIVKSVAPKILWAVTAETTGAMRLENIFLPSSSMPKLWR
ncbi:hypothetical protein TNCV_1767181 [Trichonephila clavipes]|nr:hypothetical protein TNCV_1767181 [Trichonephila clavipes]